MHKNNADAKGRYEPMRKCIGCGKSMPKEMLLRVRLSEDGTAVIDESRIRCGRGAYLCKSRECLAAAKRRNLLQKSFRREISPQIYEDLEKKLEELLNGK